MTLEEAKSLKKGDKITGTWSRGKGSIRTITGCEVRGSMLHWSENHLTTSFLHSWDYRDIELVKTANPIVEQYSIY